MSDSMTARDAILARIRAANSSRGAFDHPGPFEGWRPDPDTGDHVDAFAARFEHVGGEVVRLAGPDAAREWLGGFALNFTTAAYGTGIADSFRDVLPEAAPDVADLGMSVARAAIAETGSLVMDARDGRRPQLLCPTHVVLLHSARVVSTARAAFEELSADLPSALGLHSGPSKSADIGQVMVKGVHGPGRVIALILEEWTDS